MAGGAMILVVRRDVALSRLEQHRYNFACVPQVYVASVQVSTLLSTGTLVESDDVQEVAETLRYPPRSQARRNDFVQPIQHVAIQ